LISRGLAYNELKEYSKAIDDFTKAIEYDRDCAEAYAIRAQTKILMGHADDAEADIVKAVELNRIQKGKQKPDTAEK
jgi:tetratricopeptide (TPR) repeat protein